MKKTLTLITLLAGFAVSTQATSILSEDFNYPNGPIVGAAGSPWLNNSGTANTMLVTNNPPDGQLEVSTSRPEDIAAPFSGGPYMTNGPVAALYAKFTVNFIGLPTAGGAYFAHFNGSNAPPSASLHRARIWASTTNAISGGLTPANTYRLTIVNSSTGNATNNSQMNTNLNLNQTYTVVTKYDIANATSTLWIDPVSEASTSVTAPDSVAYPYINPTYYSFRQASGEGTMRIDTLRVATSFAEVAGANTAPSISAIANQSIPRNGNTGPLPFTVGDAETDPALLTVSKASTNLTLVPLSGIVVNDGDGTNRTVTVTPATGQQGTTLITLTVSDGTNTADSSFVVTVGSPVLSAIPNQIAVVNAVIPPIAITITDAEGDTLTPATDSSNTNILKSANITVNGTGSSRTLTLVPEANTNGGTTVTLSFSDGFTTTTRTFTLTVTPLLGILLQDQFAYTSFTISPNSLADAIGSPWGHASGGFYEVQSTNGWAYLSAALTEDVGAPLTNSPGTFPNFTNYASSLGVVFYSSFTLKVTDITLATGDYFAHLKNNYTNTTFRAKVFVNTNGAAASSYRIGIANQANVGTYHPLDCSTNTDYFVVTRYNSYNGETALWVNPTAESVGAVNATDAMGTSTIGAYGLRQSGGIGSLQVSNLIVSTSFPIAPLSPITITTTSVSGGTVTILFDAGASDIAAGFDLQSCGTVNGTYAVVGATITSPSSGKFQATIATSGSAQFYRIVRK
jgi:hypothetical protein